MKNVCPICSRELEHDSKIGYYCPEGCGFNHKGEDNSDKPKEA
jgi:hypothetical protein